MAAFIYGGFYRMDRLHPRKTTKSVGMASTSGSGSGDLRIKTNDGTFIASSQRPDGTWRKPRKVKEGYVPQEEQPKYMSKGRQAAEIPKQRFPVGMTPMAMAKGQMPTGPKKPIVAIEKASACITPQDHVKRKMHNVQKKIDEITALEHRIEMGEKEKLEQNQLSKLDRRAHYEDEMHKLEEELEKLDVTSSSTK
ncbi:unnamed protein product, partial [Mesorhabditis belari]|uniref:Partner of Y14 and mago n=1 Tax=Mesorhabditis belari TaxID=2138241 RepID=A0AAF3ERK7_9BILA